MASKLVADIVETGEVTDGTNSTDVENVIAGSAKAWVHYNGATNTIEDSHNISSVTDTASGKFEINFTNAFTDEHYVALASVAKTDTTDDANMRMALGTTTRTQTASSCPISISYAASTSMVDAPIVCMAFFQ